MRQLKMDNGQLAKKSPISNLQCQMPNENGLTLMEALITLSIAMVVGALLLVIIVNTGGLFYKQSSKVGQGFSVNQALAKVRESIRTSSGVASSYPTSGPPTYTSGPEQLVLKIPSIDTSGSIILDTFDYFVFLKDQSNLTFKTFPDSQSVRKSQDQIFSTKVDQLLFQYFDLQNPPQEVTPTSAQKIRITLTLKQKAGAGIETNVATAEANLRND